jgi:hypothetical protein
MSNGATETGIEDKTSKKSGVLDILIPLTGAIIIMAAGFIYSEKTDLVANEGEALKASIETLDHDARKLGEDELPSNHWGSTSGFMGTVVTDKNKHVAAGCILSPSLEGLKYIPVGYTINPFLNTISTVHSLGWYRFDDELNAHFKQKCDSLGDTYS